MWFSYPTVLVGFFSFVTIPKMLKKGPLVEKRFTILFQPSPNSEIEGFWTTNIIKDYRAFAKKHPMNGELGNQDK